MGAPVNDFAASASAGGRGEGGATCRNARAPFRAASSGLPFESRVGAKPGAGVSRAAGSDKGRRLVRRIVEWFSPANLQTKASTEGTMVR